ncbi:prenyltransferase/squalene oxidase repeat-containing protein [Nocardioides lijunqiniae]|uniref:prenyltransferase/squalene oxidase repeat-containing protein n=1 Tax=Nocardioides lijunqiniae TaxID=2760832 RepID=UPI0018789479|nr:prenyltransferase/squalene oxidase repeat-containing protein [Nocardioides lijunqiniae]
MNNPVFRRAAALLATPALALATVAALPSAPSYAAEPDLAPAQAGAAYLAEVAPVYGFATGNTIDQQLALDFVGGHDAEADAIGAGVADNLTAYTDYAYCDDPAFVESPPCATTPLIEGVAAGSLGKALVSLQTAEIDPTDVDGVDLVAKLEGVVPDSGALAGRAVSPQTRDGVSTVSGFTNLFGQAFAVRGLADASSPEALSASTYLVGLQCADGSFQEDLPAEEVAQTCAATTNSRPSVDGTALAVLALDRVDTAAAQAAVTSATQWLASVQRPDGGFTDNGAAGTPNANSTGMAGWALGLTGQDAPAAKTATWVRAHQASNDGTCAAYAADDLGAIALNDQDLAAGVGGIGDAALGRWQRATVQALPALTYAPAAAGTPVVSGVTSYVRAGSVQTVTVRNLAPGNAVCGTVGTRSQRAVASVAGVATFRVTAPARTATTPFRVVDGTASVGATALRTLARKKLPFSLKSAVDRGRKQVVRVSGLAAGERVTIVFRGRKVAGGKATAKGAFVGRFKVSGKLGKATVSVRGEFAATRSNAKKFRVTR